MTTNNDTPQIFGDDTHDHPQDPGPFATEHDDDAFPPFRGWAGWGDRVEPVAPDGDYPEPSLSPYEQGYPQRPSPGQPGYPHGPGYAPDSAYGRRLVYPQDPGYELDQGYQVRNADHGYPADLGFAEDPGYAADPGFGRDAEPVPPMEPLPDPQERAFASPREALLREAAPPVVSMPLPVRVPAALPDHRALRDEAFAPPQAADPDYARETSDSLTSESLLHGKRAGPGSGWRRTVYRASGGLVRFGESAAEMRRRDLINRVRTPVAGGHHRVAVLA